MNPSGFQPSESSQIDGVPSKRWQLVWSTFVDTRINFPGPVFSLFISPQELVSRVGQANAPLLLDVRPQARFDASLRMLIGALRCPLDQLPAFAVDLLTSDLHREVVTYCVYGHLVSQDGGGCLAGCRLVCAGFGRRF